MNHSFTQSGETGVLAMGGALTIEDAAELKIAIVDALGATSRLVLDLAQVATADLCCLQLFCSAHRTAERSGKILEFGNAGQGFAGGLEEAGYVRHVGCLQGACSDCLWTAKSLKPMEVAAK